MIRRVDRLVRRGAIVSGFLAFAAPALAQDAAPPNPVSRTLADVAASEAVASRPRPEYDASGIAAGGFRIYPTLQVQSGYDDNIYNTDTGRVADGLVRIAPRMTALSNWSRNSLSFSTGGQFERYFSRTSENNDQYDVAADGRLDASSTVAINAGGQYARRVEPRGTLGDILQAGERIRYDLGTAHLSATGEFGRILLTAGGTFSSFTYLPVLLNGATVSQGYRDRNETTGTVRGDYVVGPGLRTFVSGSYNDESYRRPLAGLDQDSDGYSVLGGVAFGVNEFISGEVGIGYLKEYYKQPGLSNIGGFSYNARGIWNPTALLTVTATAARTIQQSPFVDQSGIVQDSIGVNVDYELLRDLILSAAGAFVSNNYKDLSRTDRLWTMEGRARFLVNRWMETGLTINHRFQTTSNALGRQYAGSSILLSITLKR